MEGTYHAHRDGRAALSGLALCSAAECCKEFCVADCVVCGETCSDNDPQTRRPGPPNAIISALVPATAQAVRGTGGGAAIATSAEPLSCLSQRF